MNVAQRNAPVSLASSRSSSLSRDKDDADRVTTDSIIDSLKTDLPESAPVKKNSSEDPAEEEQPAEDERIESQQEQDTDEEGSDSSEAIAAAAACLAVPQEVEDEEVRLAMEMALAAAQNPKLSPAELRKLVGGKNQQSQIVDEVAQKKKAASQSWWKDKAAAVQAAAAQKATEFKDQAERRLYADNIRKDEQVRETKKKIKIVYKTLKANRLHGNREETRHVFKRQRMERKLLSMCDKVSKTQTLFCGPDSNYNIHEYAKAMMRASRKWKKKATDQELALEAQLCRNMHQMLSVEKQKSKVKRSTREMKKYLQRCKSWLSDKQAVCEMHVMTLEATTSSMQHMYEETLARQDALIKKLLASDDFKDIDLAALDINVDDLPPLPENEPPRITRNVLRGLPIRDSIRLKKQHQLAATGAANGGPELYIEAKDDGSVSSALSDPDDENVAARAAVGGTSKNDSDSVSAHSHNGFGADAPWLAASDSNLSDGKDSAGDGDNKKRTSAAAPKAAAAPTEEDKNEAAEANNSE